MLIEKIEQIELDDSIVKAIIKLNEKGYETEFCCGGHPEGAYIKFNTTTSYVLDDRLFALNEEIKYVKRINHPVNWYIDRLELTHFVIRRKEFTQEEYLTHTDEELTDMVAEELNNWADLLPVFRSEKCQFRIIDED